MTRQINSYCHQELPNKSTWHYKWQVNIVPKNRGVEWAVLRNLRNLPARSGWDPIILLIMNFGTLLSNMSAKNSLLFAKTNLWQLECIITILKNSWALEII